MRAAADRNDVSITLDQSHTLQRDAQPFANALRKTGLVSLTARQGADSDINMAVRLHIDLGVLAWRSARCLDVAGKANAPQFSVAFGFASAVQKAFPVGKIECTIHNLPVIAAVVGHAKRVHVLKPSAIRKSKAPPLPSTSVRPKISLMRPNIRPSVAQFCAPRQPDSIYDSDRFD